MLFNFRLKPLDQVSPWGGPDKQTLHWFGLTDGEYWIEARDATLFEYSKEAQKRFGGGPYCDYQVVRLWEDALEIAPGALEPIPSDLLPYFFALSTARNQPDAAPRFVSQLDRFYDVAPDDDRLWDIVGVAVDGLSGREFVASYLNAGPAICFWVEGDEMHMAWNTDRAIDDLRPVWSARSGSMKMSRDNFVAELKDFDKRLMKAMDERVEAVLNGGLARHIEIDLDGLAREHVQRKREIERALRPPEPTNWDAVRDAIRAVEAMKL